MNLGVCMCVITLWASASNVVCNNLLLPAVYKTEPNQTVLFESWNKVQNNIKNGLQTVLKQVLPSLIRFTSEIGLSGECDDSLRELIFGLSRFEVRALKMLDASGKLASGYLSGTSSSFGNYDQCLDVPAPPSAVREDEPGARYCLVDFKTLLPPKPDYYTVYQTLEGIKDFPAQIPLMEEIKNVAQFAYFMAYRFGICVPVSCTRKDVEELTQAIADFAGMTRSVATCDTKKDFHLDTLQIVIIAVLSLFILTAFLCTILVDVIPRCTLSWKSSHRKEDSTNQSAFHKFCSVFSVTKNVSDLLKVTEGSNLSCLHGIKFISLTWVIIGHTYMLLPWQIIEGLLPVFRAEISKAILQPVSNAFYAVDTFLLITGFLVAFLTTTFVNRFGKKKFSTAAYVLKRLCRLLPMVVLGTALAFLLPLLGSGPIWHETTDNLVSSCHRNWWINFLFVSNFLPMKDICLPHMWYAAVDFQLYVASLAFLIASFWKKRAGFVCGVMMVALSCGLSGVITYFYGSLPTVIVASPNPERIIKTLEVTHFMTHSHIGVYAVGLMLGLFLADNPKVKVPKLVQVGLWAASFASCICIAYGTLSWNRGKIPEEAESIAYAVLTKTTWGLGMAWVIFACCTGHGGAVNRLLSWNALVPLSRLSFSTYVIHYFVILVYFGNQRTTLMGNQLMTVWLILGNIVSSYAVGFFVYIFYEAPFIQLGRLSFQRFLTRKQDNNITQEANGNIIKGKDCPDSVNEDSTVYRL